MMMTINICTSRMWYLGFYPLLNAAMYPFRVYGFVLIEAKEIVDEISSLYISTDP